MPTTKQVVEWIKLSANGWNISGTRGILPMLNAVQNLMLEEETEQTVSYDSSTGKFPSFDTQSGVYEYDIPSVWRLSDVLIKYEDSYNYNLKTHYGDYSEDDPRLQMVTYQSKRYLRIKDCRTIDKTIEDSAKIIFSNDPGDTSDYFFYRGYAPPNQITSVSIQLRIPEKYHLPYVVPATIKFIEAFQSGGWAEAVDIIMEKYVLPVRLQMNQGFQGDIPNTITIRDF